MKNAMAAVLGVMMAGTAFGAGAIIGDTDLPAGARASLSEQIALARKANPGPFAAVASVRANVAKMDAQKRGRMAPVSLVLKPIGDAAVLPLIEQAAFVGDRGDLSDSAWLAWQVGVIDAIGNLRDTRALPVLEAALKRHSDAQLVRATAAALGKLGTEPAAKVLLDAARDSARAEAVRAAMGNCRRLIIAQALAAFADAERDERAAASLAKALGEVGNAWAWATPAVRDAAPAEEGAVRDVAATALVRLFVRFEGPARQAASNALLVVDSPTTRTAIEDAAREAPAETKVALTELTARFNRNPAR